MDVLLKKGESREIFFTGPLRTGLLLDSRLLLMAGHAKYQDEICQILSGLYAGEWGGADTAQRSSGMVMDVDTKRGRTIIPRYFVRHRLHDEDLMTTLAKLSLPATLPGFVHPPQDDGGSSGGGADAYADAQKSKDAEFILTEVEIRLFEFGYGSMMFSGHLRAVRDLSAEQFRAVAENTGSAMNGYMPLFQDTYKAVQSALDHTLRLDAMPWRLKPEKDGQARPRSFPRETDRLLWVHRVFSIGCNTQEEFKNLRDTCKALVYSDNPEKIRDSSLTPHAAIYAGNGNSAQVYIKGKVTDWTKSLLRRLVQAQNVYFAMAEDLDRDLFYLNTDIGAAQARSSMHELEQQSRIIAQYQSQIAFFQSIYDDYDNHLEPQSLRIWHDLEAAWETLDRFEGLKSKMALTEKVYDRVMQDLNNLHNKRLGTLVLVFTFLSMLSVVVDTVDFTQGGPLDPPSWVRVFLLALMALTLLLLARRILKT